MTEDADADHAFLRARGTDTDPEVIRTAAPVPPMFTVRDLDDNALPIVRDH